jgi:regulator of sigma E protease
MVPTIIIFFIIFSVLVLVHELGHFLAAKKSGVRVEEFGAGYPPRLWGKQIGETLYSLNLIPFGGFVRIYGHEEAVDKDLDRAFTSQSKFKRSLIILGGVIMNFLLGVVCFALVYSKLGIPTNLDYIKVLDVAHDSPAYTAGLKPNDQIIGLSYQGEEIKITEVDQFIQLIDGHRGQEISLKLANNQQLVLTPRTEEQTPPGEGSLGIGISGSELRFYPWWQMPFRGIWAGLQEAWLWGQEIVISLVGLFSNLFKGVVPEVAGPIGIYQMTGEVQKSGFWALAQFTGILSINLAIVNLLPFPGLDGAWLVFILIERLMGEKKQKIQAVVSQVGFILLLLLMLLITVGDIRRILGQ